jgi:hypothetical protein
MVNLILEAATSRNDYELERLAGFRRDKHDVAMVQMYLSIMMRRIKGT